MSEHARSNGYQWVDGEVYIVMDMFHDAPQRVSNRVYTTREEALAFVQAKYGWESRTVILRIPAIVAHELVDAGGVK